VLRVGRFNPFEGWVSSEAVGQDILISGRVDMNRAVDGEIFPGLAQMLPTAQGLGACSAQ
jgi:exosome complex exonuclease DIS3/RRP44